ncbi:MAG: hypothetical protein RR595_05685 [Lysinibacillus sp.]
MEKTYKCIKEFVLEKYDEHECPIENEHMVTPVDSIWELCDFASLSDIRLQGDLGWLEIDEETLKTHFEEI